MSDIEVKVLRTVRIAHLGSVYGREIVKDTFDKVPSELVEDLFNAGYIEEPGASGAGLRDDGPTVAEYVAKGYSASKYPPAGYTSRSTAEEIDAAIAAEAAAQALDAKKAELAKMTVEQLRELATAENIAVEADDKKGVLVDKIAAHRAVAASV